MCVAALKTSLGDMFHLNETLLEERPELCADLGLLLLPSPSSLRLGLPSPGR